jgi:hypothetical protein
MLWLFCLDEQDQNVRLICLDIRLEASLSITARW